MVLKHILQMQKENFIRKIEDKIFHFLKTGALVFFFFKTQETCVFNSFTLEKNHISKSKTTSSNA